jgi:hypothetical protein
MRLLAWGPILFAICVSIIAYRYLAVFLGASAYLPAVFLALLGILYTMLREFRHFYIDKLVAFVVLIFVSLLFSEMIRLALLQFNVFSSIFFLAKFALPLGAFLFFYSQLKRNALSEEMCIRLLRYSLVIATCLALVEGVSLALLGFNPFPFQENWNRLGTEFHTSAAYGLQWLARPWGVMGLPQPSGVFVAGLTLYFARRDKVMLFVGLLGLAITASKTGFVVFALGLFAIVFDGLRKKFTSRRLIGGVIAIIMAAVTMPIVVKLESPTLVLNAYIKSIENFIQVAFLAQNPTVPYGTADYYVDANVFINLIGYGGYTNDHFFPGTGEISILNNILAVGLINIVFSLPIIYLFTRRILSVGLADPRVLLVLCMLVGAMHYDSFFKLPGNIVVAMVLAMLAAEKVKPATRLLTA